MNTAFLILLNKSYLPYGVPNSWHEPTTRVFNLMFPSSGGTHGTYIRSVNAENLDRWGSGFFSEIDNFGSKWSKSEKDAVYSIAREYFRDVKDLEIKEQEEITWTAYP
jgi:hypothetical protein